MIGYGINKHWLEDNTTDKKAEKCEDKHYCGDCKKTSTWTEYSSNNGFDTWEEYICDNCGAGDNHMYEDKQQCLQENKGVA